MEQKFGKNSIDIEVLREFCEREGEAVSYRKGDQLEREGDPARWFAFVESGCFKYVTYGIFFRFSQGPIFMPFCNFVARNINKTKRL